MNFRQDPLVLFELEEIKAAIELDETVAENYGWKSLVSTKGNRKRMTVIVAIAFVWFFVLRTGLNGDCLVYSSRMMATHTSIVTLFQKTHSAGCAFLHMADG